MNKNNGGFHVETPGRAIFEQKVLPLFEISREEWLKQARAAALKIGMQAGYATIDMVRAECPPPAGVDPRVMGAVFQTGKRGPWEACGYHRSFRKACHGRPVAKFRLKIQYVET